MEVVRDDGWISGKRRWKFVKAWTGISEGGVREARSE